ncbi:mandelate racemase/muconate lactonizing enzyme family protein [Citrobacter braakii]|uniref:mandelate racemase/muconate lactonizing enzyme family protein n=1 Tax=Citrobacter braakii TaxID=57706 RepID=UPI002DB73E84|nr:mandelate racemase/muconate lactonizing enzyme family protein [Citrobacter braakii]MEC3929204.1 mandelate racemase/muconate lactonizing enzyme family protein [Citrobacter braakii]
MSYFNPVLIRVNTDEGISGIGEAGLAYGSGSNAAVGILKDLAPRIIGKDPMKIESIWEDLYRGTFWGMSGGPVFYAGMSAIDIALWDIKGKKYGAPIYELIGGKTNDKLRTYASQLQFGWGKEQVALFDPKDYADAALKAVEEGYDCIKVDPIQFYGTTKEENSLSNPKQSYYGLLRSEDINRAYSRLKAMRDAIGPDVDIILEIHSLLGTNSAIQLAKAVEDLNIFYYEEPVNPMNTDAFARVTNNVNMPVATGERSYTRWGYRELFEKQAVAVIQPDACLVGGITETKKICDYANVYHATVQVHVCGGPVSTAAALHIETAIPNFIIHEHHTLALKKDIIDLCKYDYQPENGFFQAPDLPGLGQELNDDVVQEYLVTVIE